MKMGFIFFLLIENGRRKEGGVIADVTLIKLIREFSSFFHFSRHGCDRVNDAREFSGNLPNVVEILAGIRRLLRTSKNGTLTLMLIWLVEISADATSCYFANEARSIQGV
jgi:hypothetical protein